MIFFQELDYAYSHKLNWKIYIQLLNDLYEIFKATPNENVDMRLKLIHGDPSKKHKGLCHFSTFAKFSFMAERLEKRNWRIRETALRIALKLWWVVNDDSNDNNNIINNNGICDALQIIIFSYEPRLKKEHVVIKHIFQTELYKNVLQSNNASVNIRTSCVSFASNASIPSVSIIKTFFPLCSKNCL